MSEQPVNLPAEPDPFLTVDKVSWDLKGPCNDCPFRRNAPDHEGIVANVVTYVESLRGGVFSHTCHKTDNRADGPKNHVGPVQHCGGALHFMIRAKCDLQGPLIQAVDANKLDIHEVSRRARRDKRVFGSVRELIEYYLAMARRIMEKKKADPEICAIARDGSSERPVIIPMSQAIAQDMEIIECKKCGKPAVSFDHHWPWYMTENYCADCSKSPDKKLLSDLESELKAVE